MRVPARWLAAHERTSAGLLFAAFVLVYLWPVLIGGNVLSPRSVLFQYAPWSAGAPAGWEFGTNFILGDVPLSHYPFHVIARDFIREGTFPAWSQHAYGGVPFFANPQTMVLSPFSLPIWILPLELGIGVSAALKLWVAAFGMYLLVRELRLGFWPAVLAGMSFALCAFSVVWLTHETLLAVAAILPWVIYLVERIVRTGALAPVLGLAIATAMVVTGGHPGAEVHVMLASSLYALMRLVNTPGRSRRERLRRGALLTAAALVGLLLTAVLLIPVLKAGSNTIGVEARNGFNPTIPGAELPLGTIRTALFPDWWGRPSDVSLTGPANYNERTFYAGGIALLLAAMALVSAGAWRRKAPFAVLAFIGLAVPLHAPGLFWLATHLPILRQVQFQRMMLLFAFGVAVLAAFGLERLLDGERPERLRPMGVLAAAAGLGLLALVTAGVSGGDLSQAAGNIVHVRHAIGGLLPGLDPNVGGLVATSVLWWLVLVLVAGLALVALWRWPRRRTGIAVMLVLAAACDAQYIAHDYQPMKPAAVVTPPRTPAIAYLQRHADTGRFVGLGPGTLSNDWSALYGLRDVRGFEPPQPSLRWFHLWQTLVSPDQLDWAQAYVNDVPTPRGLNALAVLGARYVVTPPAAGVEHALPQLHVGYDGADATILVNPAVPPRAMIPANVQMTSEEQETIGAIASEDFDPREEAVVERGEPGVAGLDASFDTGGHVAVAAETATTVTLHANLRARGLVVLNDELAPGWRVTVDGRPAAAVRVNDVMRGVIAGPGAHEIEWRYRVPGLRLGLAISAAAFLVLLLGGVALLRSRGRPTIS